MSKPILHQESQNFNLSQPKQEQRSESPQARKRAHLRAALDALVEPDQVVELRIPKIDGKKTNTAAGYYDGDLQALIDDAARYDAAGRAHGIYITLNPVSPDLLARSANRTQEWSSLATQDNHILRRLWLPIDIDPTRPTGISASDSEHEAAHAKAADVAAWLAGEMQWSAAPIVADSGNGAHLLYPIDLPNDQESTDLVMGALRALAGVFDDEECTVDTGNFNASRIWKLYGTKARKGDDVEARPHRYAHILSAGNRDRLVSPPQLANLAALAPETTAQARSSSSGGGNLPAFDLAGFVDRHSAELNPSAEKSTPPWLIKWRVDCPWNHDHSGDAMIAQRENGPIVAQCSHNSCSWDWRELRERLEPKAPQTPQEPPAWINNGQAGTNGTGPNSGSQEDDQRYMLTNPIDDAGNARCVIARYPGRILQNEAFDWMYYTGTHWTTAGAAEHVQADIERTLRARIQAAAAGGEADLVKRMAQRCTPNSGKIKATLDSLRRYCYTHADSFTADPDLLNVANGVIDLETGEMRDHSPGDCFMYCTPTKYNPKADQRPWLQWLAQTVDEPETADWLQMAIGYTLTGHTREEILFYLFGPSRSGKGLFTETIATMLGAPMAKEIEFGTFTAEKSGNDQNFELAPLKASRFISASESRAYERLDEAKVKRVTGGNDIYCAHKHKAHFNYRPQFKIWLSSNHPVNADPNDSAVWGRVRLISFPHSKLGKEDKTLKTKMKTAGMLEAVLAWAVEGAIKWYALGAKGLPEPPHMASMKNAQRQELDTVGDWIAERATTGENEKATSAHIYQSYSDYCKENGVTPKQQKGLSQTLQIKGFQQIRIKKNGKVSRGFKGLSVNIVDL